MSYFYYTAKKGNLWLSQGELFYQEIASCPPLAKDAVFVYYKVVFVPFSKNDDSI